MGFLHFRSLLDPLGNEEVFVSVFPSVGHPFAVNDVIQAGLNLVVEIIESFVLLGAGLDILSKLLAEGVLSTIVWEVGLDWCRISNIPFLWSVLGSGSNCCSGVVTWSTLWCWWCGRYRIP